MTAVTRSFQMGSIAGGRSPENAILRSATATDRRGFLCPQADRDADLLCIVMKLIMSSSAHDLRPSSLRGGRPTCLGTVIFSSLSLILPRSRWEMTNAGLGSFFLYGVNRMSSMVPTKPWTVCAGALDASMLRGT